MKEELAKMRRRLDRCRKEMELISERLTEMEELAAEPKGKEKPDDGNPF